MPRPIIDKGGTEQKPIHTALEIRPDLGFNKDMTAQEKTVLSRFLNLALDYTGSGYIRTSSVDFENDKPGVDKQLEAGSPAGQNLPLAYLVEEADDSLESLVLIIDGEPEVLSPGPDKRRELLLDKMLAAIGLRQGKNCVLAAKEVLDSVVRLEQELRRCRPKAVLCLGKNQTRHIIVPDHIPVLTTYSTGELLVNESLKRPAFEEMKNFMAILAGLDETYAGEVKELLARYAATDPGFAAKVKG